jgi:hypothetical protein
MEYKGSEGECIVCTVDIGPTHIEYVDMSTNDNTGRVQVAIAQMMANTMQSCPLTIPPRRVQSLHEGASSRGMTLFNCETIS